MTIELTQEHEATPVKDYSGQVEEKQPPLAEQDSQKQDNAEVSEQEENEGVSDNGIHDNCYNNIQSERFAVFGSVDTSFKRKWCCEHVVVFYKHNKTLPNFNLNRRFIFKKTQTCNSQYCMINNFNITIRNIRENKIRVKSK